MAWAIEPRVRALFQGWLTWEQSPTLPGGCPFVTASFELDDRSAGPVRDFVVQTLRDWNDTLAGAARIAVQEGHFRRDFDCEQFAHDCQGIGLGFVHASRLMRDPKARARADAAHAERERLRLMALLEQGLIPQQQYDDAATTAKKMIEMLRELTAVPSQKGPNGPGRRPGDPSRLGWIRRVRDAVTGLLQIPSPPAPRGPPPLRRCHGADADERRAVDDSAIRAGRRIHAGRRIPEQQRRAGSASDQTRRAARGGPGRPGRRRAGRRAGPVRE